MKRTPAINVGTQGHSAHKSNPRDWSEDFNHENGNYQNLCYNCQKTFIGHKRRVVCKLCVTNNNHKGELNE